MRRFFSLGLVAVFLSFSGVSITSCITAKEAPKSYGSATKTSKQQRKAMRTSKKQSVKKQKNAGKYNPKTDF